ncbi:MAG: CBS domain-containing protein [Paracoccaceae bacterium]
MLVSRILQSKGDERVFMVAPQAEIAEAVALLAEYRIGALVVGEPGKPPMGIISERDIVRELMVGGNACLRHPVRDAMSKRIMTCTCNERADTVLQRMTDGRFRHMPVMEGREMVGIISIGDVVKARLSELAMENDALEGMIAGGY